VDMIDFLMDGGAASAGATLRSSCCPSPGAGRAGSGARAGNCRRLNDDDHNPTCQVLDDDRHQCMMGSFRNELTVVEE
jgi:hypothetical protein